MKQIISEYESGMTLAELGDKYGVSKKTIRNRLIEAEVQIRKGGFGSSKKALPMEQITSEYQSGMSTRELGEK